MNKPSFLWEDHKLPVKTFFGLFGGASSGKTYTGLRLATILSNDMPFLAIDSEDRSIRLYQDHFPNVRVLNLNRYSQRDYMEAIQYGLKELNGPPMLFIDSLSDEWDGIGGVIDQHSARVDKGEDTFNAWNGPKQDHARFIKWLRGLPCGVIATMRSKDKIEKPKKGQAPVAPQIVPIQDGKILNQFDLAAFVHSQGELIIRKSRLIDYIAVGEKYDKNGNNENGNLIDKLVEWQKHHNG